MQYQRARLNPLLAVLFLTLAGTCLGGAEKPVLLFLGDSLTAGYGLNPDEAYPARVGALLEASGQPVEIINSGLSGETSAGGLRRLQWVMRRPIDVLVLALGANDGLRGLPPEKTAENLQQLIKTARELQPEVKILLAGMLAPPNMGERYRAEFNGIYPALAESHQTALLPFLLEGVAGQPRLNQADGIHPNIEGQKKVAALVLAALRPLLDE